MKPAIGQALAFFTFSLLYFICSIYYYLNLNVFSGSNSYEWTVFVSGIMVIFSAILFKPQNVDANIHFWKDAIRLITLILPLLAYALLLEHLGFFLSSVFLIAFLTRSFGGGYIISGINGIVISGLILAIFEFGLGITLPGFF